MTTDTATSQGWLLLHRVQQRPVKELWNNWRAGMLCSLGAKFIDVGCALFAWYNAIVHIVCNVGVSAVNAKVWLNLWFQVAIRIGACAADAACLPVQFS